MKKKIIIIGSICLAAVITCFIIFVMIPEIQYEKIRNMQIHNVDLNSLEDGVYKGEFAYGHYTYKVEVAVKNHMIETVEVQHGRNSSQAKAAEGVIEEIIKSQEIDVDVISGATTTSKAILKAVENALSNGLLKK